MVMTPIKKLMAMTMMKVKLTTTVTMMMMIGRAVSYTHLTLPTTAEV